MTISVAKFDKTIGKIWQNNCFEIFNFHYVKPEHVMFCQQFRQINETRWKTDMTSEKIGEKMSARGRIIVVLPFDFFWFV